MTYISERRIRLQRQLTRVQAALTALYAMQTEQAGLSAESYSFDSGEGSQRTTRRSLKDILEDIARLEATEDHLYNELSNMGIVSVRFRRTS